MVAGSRLVNCFDATLFLTLVSCRSLPILMQYKTSSFDNTRNISLMYIKKSCLETLKKMACKKYASKKSSCAKRRKRRCARKKSGKKSRRRGSGGRCRAIDPVANPYWFHEIYPGEKGHLRGKLKDRYAEIGITKCGDFKADAMPCKYMPMDRVRTYAGLCDIRGRSGKSHAQLCAALARRTHKRRMSERCGLQNMASIYAMRAANGYDDPRYYNANVLRKILKDSCIHVPQYASVPVLLGLVKTCVGPIQDEKKRHASAVASIKLSESHALLDNKEYKARSAICEATRAQLKAEKAQHEAQMKVLVACGKGQAAAVAAMPAPSAPALYEGGIPVAPAAPRNLPIRFARGYTGRVRGVDQLTLLPRMQGPLLSKQEQAQVRAQSEARIAEIKEKQRALDAQIAEEKKGQSLLKQGVAYVQSLYPQVPVRTH
jgi:hypothetical protein